MGKNSYIFISVIVVAILGIGYFLWSMPHATSPQSPHNTPPVSATTTTSSVQYKNNQYDFTFDLPADWHGYTVLNKTWSGTPESPSSPSTVYPQVQGPQIIIRNPQWTSAEPWQDIPIMVFTPSQWTAVLNGNLVVSAAPIPPTELGHNSTYVFALPARYNYAFPKGWQEVDAILHTNPLHAF
jgi:hypothetical protein